MSSVLSVYDLGIVPTIFNAFQSVLEMWKDHFSNSDQFQKQLILCPSNDDVHRMRKNLIRKNNR